MAKNPKNMTEAELSAFATLWVANCGEGATEADKLRILEDTHLTNDQADTVIGMISSGSYRNIG